MEETKKCFACDRILDDQVEYVETEDGPICYICAGNDSDEEVADNEDDHGNLMLNAERLPQMDVDY